MKNKIPPFLLLVGLVWGQYACQNQPTASNENTHPIATDTAETKPIPNEIEPVDTIETEYKSQLRPNETIELGSIYTDTVKYVGFNDEGDEWLLRVEKNGSTIRLIDNNERKTDFVRGDKLVIRWKMDSIRYAGDDEFLAYTEFLWSTEKIASITLEDKKVKLLWRATQYDESLAMEVNAIMLNEDYIANISEPEKAALAYVATFIGNECAWDGNVNANRSNLKCKILWALELGYQCSHQHLDFLKYWFRNNEAILTELASCRTRPDGATIQNTFEAINITTNDNDITVAFNASGFNLREGESWTWHEKHIFTFNENELIVKAKEVTPKEYSTISFQEY